MASEGVLATLHQGWDALASLDSPMALIGGLALTAWNHARYTRDADVLIAIDRRRIDEVVLHLKQAGFHPKHSPPALTIDGQTILQFMYQPEDALLPFQFDVLLADVEFQRESLTRAAERRLPGSDRPIRVVRPDDLIVIKLLAGRIIDRADAAMLLRENRDEIDFQRLHKAVRSLGLTTDYDAIWRDAFPDEPIPQSRE